MKTVILILIAAFLLLPRSDAGDEALTESVVAILTEAKSLKKGALRSDLLKYFTIEGGLWSPSHRTYVSKRCPLIKIDVEFRPVHARKESQGDVIEKVSRPYLQLMHID